MKTKLLLLALAAVVLPLSLANATVSLQFTNGATINSSPGQNVTLTLQLVATGSETSSGLDYFLNQTAGPASNVFSITGRDVSTSDYPDVIFTLGQVTSTGDSFSPAGQDNLLNSQNDVDLGAVKSDTTTNFVGGTHPVASLQLSISPSAALGTYTIQTATSNYGASGTNGSHDSMAFDNQGSINIVLSAVPEPATWSLLGLGGIGTLGLNILRRRRV